MLLARGAKLERFGPLAQAIWFEQSEIVWLLLDHLRSQGVATRPFTVRTAKQELIS